MGAVTDRKFSQVTPTAITVNNLVLTHVKCWWTVELLQTTWMAIEPHGTPKSFILSSILLLQMYTNHPVDGKEAPCVPFTAAT